MKTVTVQWSKRALILIMVLGLAACSKAPTDASISYAIKSSLYSDPQHKDDRVDVTVSKGEVTLAGEVSSDAARTQAMKLANETRGVRNVNDRMQVRAAVLQNQEPVMPLAEPGPVTRPKAPKAKVSSRPAQPHADSDFSQPVPPAPFEPPSPSGPPPVSPAATPPPPPQPPPPPAPRSVTVPVGTSVRIQMIDSVDSSTDQVGQQFRASLQAPIVVDDEVIVPKGIDVFVKLTQAKSSGKIQGQSELQIALDHLQFQGKSYALDSSTYEQKGESRGKDTVKKVGIGTAIGAAIGAIAGGGKGAAIGAGVGAGAGTAAQVFIKGKQVKIPSETRLDFTLEHPLEITLLPGQSRRSRNQNKPPTEDSQQ
jgi:hypothetical protein